jgi:hypothetical protein
MRSSLTRWVVASAAGIALAGCGDGTPDAPKATTSTAAPAKPVSQLPPDMVAAVSSARNTSVVSVHFVLNGTPTVSKALPVDIAIVPHEPVSSLIAHFEARDGLALATGNVLERQADPKAEAVIKHQLVLLPAKEGVFVVSAVVETESSAGTVTRIYSIPVIVGAPASGAAATGPATVPAQTPAPTSLPANS